MPGVVGETCSAARAKVLLAGASVVVTAPPVRAPRYSGPCVRPPLVCSATDWSPLASGASPAAFDIARATLHNVAQAARGVRESVRTIQDYLTIHEAAELLGVSASTLRAWDRAGKLTAIRNPMNRYRLYRREDLEAFLVQLARADAPPRPARRRRA